MTTLAAIELQDGSILIRSDSMAGNNHGLADHVEQQEPIEKWVTWPNGWFIGLAGYCATCQDLDDASSDVELDDNIASVRRALKKVFSIYGEPEKCDGIPDYKHSNMLAARAGTGVYTICTLMSAIRIKPGRLIAEGRGRSFVYGAFQAIGGNREDMANLERTQRFTEALEVAIHLDESSGPPVKVEKLELPQRTIKPAHKPFNPAAPFDLMSETERLLGLPEAVDG